MRIFPNQTSFLSKRPHVGKVFVDRRMRFLRATVHQCGRDKILATDGQLYRIESDGSNSTTVKLRPLRRKNTRSGGGSPQPVTVARWRLDSLIKRQQAQERTARALRQRRERGHIDVGGNDMAVEEASTNPRLEGLHDGTQSTATAERPMSTVTGAAQSPHTARRPPPLDIAIAEQGDADGRVVSTMGSADTKTLSGDVRIGGNNARLPVTTTWDFGHACPISSIAVCSPRSLSATTRSIKKFNSQ